MMVTAWKVCVHPQKAGKSVADCCLSQHSNAIGGDAPPHTQRLFPMTYHFTGGGLHLHLGSCFPTGVRMVLMVGMLIGMNQLKAN